MENILSDVQSLSGWERRFVFSLPWTASPASLRCQSSQTTPPGKAAGPSHYRTSAVIASHLRNAGIRVPGSAVRAGMRIGDLRAVRPDLSETFVGLLGSVA